MHQIEIHTNQLLPKLSSHTKPTIMSSTSKRKTNHPSPSHFIPSPSHFIPSQPPRPLLLTFYPPLVSLPLRLRTAKPNRSLPIPIPRLTAKSPKKSRPKKPPPLVAAKTLPIPAGIPLLLPTIIPATNGLTDTLFDTFSTVPYFVNSEAF